MVKQERSNEELCTKVDALVTSLATAREQVSQKNDDNRELVEQFENLFADVNK